MSDRAFRENITLALLSNIEDWAAKMPSLAAGCDYLDEPLLEDESDIASAIELSHRILAKQVADLTDEICHQFPSLC